MHTARFQIGEVARRTGVSPALLRAWEQRYGLIDPARTPGGTRLYSDADLDRIETMKAHLESGLSAAQAAAAARTAPDRTAPAPSVATPLPAAEAVLAGPGLVHLGAAVASSGDAELVTAAARLAEAFGRLDSQGAERAFELLLANFSFETLVTAVLLPYLHDVGGRWEQGESTIAEEHLATNIVRARLLALGGPLTNSAGGRAVLACPPEERHDLALVMLAVAMRRRGWQVTLLGADTPPATLADAADRLGPDLIVLAATAAERFLEAAGQVRELSRRHTLFIAGAGASEAIAGTCGAWFLRGDPIAALEELEPFRLRSS
ncbi:MAG TPA: MerR family transcriptional regulator [Solirubrobacteraceae bacterium]|nr:MerR family transcriptional regulator [Solirubrobacteraceae bacterium]